MGAPPSRRRGEWYLHLFAPEQPDLNWDHPAVADEFRSILRFWLDMGVDGFRVDVAHGLVKAPGLPDIGGRDQLKLLGNDVMPFFDQDGVHEIYRSWRTILDEYDGERIAVAEAWTPTVERTANYVRPDELHQAFNFQYLGAPWDAAALREVIDVSLAAMRPVGAPATWVLSNHDVTRHATRFANPPGLGTQLRTPGDRELGLRRARAATLLMLALPGSAYVYQGEELGLPDVTDLPDEVRQDPSFFRAAGPGRLPRRLPRADPVDRRGQLVRLRRAAAAGSRSPTPGARSASRRRPATPDSTLELYRRAIAARRAHPGLGAGDDVRWLDAPAGRAGLRPRGLRVHGQPDRRRRCRLPVPGRARPGQRPSRRGRRPVRAARRHDRVVDGVSHRRGSRAGPRLADIAAQAAVSEATVSRVLNGKPGVAAPTRQRVLAALDVLGCERPARLRRRSAGLIGLVTPELTNPIFPAFAQAVEQVARGPRLHPRPVHPDCRAGQPRTSWSSSWRSGASTASSSCPGCTPTPPPTRPATGRWPNGACRTSWSTATTSAIRAPFVSPDDHAAMRMAVGHLADLGHTRDRPRGRPAALRPLAPQDRGVHRGAGRSGSACARRRPRRSPAHPVQRGGRPGGRGRAARPGLHGHRLRQRHDGARRGARGPRTRPGRAGATSRWSASTTPSSSPSPTRP